MNWSELPPIPAPPPETVHASLAALKLAVPVSPGPADVGVNDRAPHGLKTVTHKGLLVAARNSVFPL